MEAEDRREMGKEGLMKNRPPIHMNRPLAREWTALERIGMAQGRSISGRMRAITLSTPPWEAIVAPAGADKAKDKERELA